MVRLASGSIPLGRPTVQPRKRAASPAVRITARMPRRTPGGISSLRFGKLLNSPLPSGFVDGEWDAVIIGGGPAGATVARYAAEGGARVLVIDRRLVIGEPLQCGEL
ncbi:MAG: FAD-dependent oxidoreductase, partial [Candidatus Thermoplasmatota archaeon]|nr:FAD-dependent oxidoreductase [Candidatus Thermoplasmatota archaeon]